ncbi:MAG TPA: NUDIX hydrolase [Lacunisphaera sp.]
MSTDQVWSTPKKLTQERFVNLFSTEIARANGRSSSWVFASRKESPGASAIQADAVTVVAVVQEAGEARLVMTREFRAPLRAYELSLPSGLIDPGESPLETAVREFKEETGLTLDRVTHVSPPTASSAGLTDETVAFVFGEASGSISRAHQTEHEDIEVRLVSVAGIRKLLGSAHGDIISSRLYPLLLGYVSAGAITLPPETEI